MKDFWVGQAKEYGFDVKAINFDPLEEELELHFIKDLFKNGEKVCDFGCGNGRTLLNLARNNKSTEFYGIDFVPDFIDIANQQKDRMGLSNVHFLIANAGSKNLSRLFRFKFDRVLTKRLLINLKGKQRLIALENIRSFLKSEGVYIMVECFYMPLFKINCIRKSLGLEEIKVNEFNEYLSAGFLRQVQKTFEIKEKIDFESLYYFISRIFNAYLSKGKPDYFANINKLAVTLSKAGLDNIIKGYSPQVIYILKKIN